MKHLYSLRTLILLLCFCLPFFANAQESKIRVTFKNDTGKDVWVLVQYLPSSYDISVGKPTDNDWIINGWYRIDKGKSSYLFDTNNRKYYFYANTSTNFFGNYREWKGNYYKYFQGKQYGFREVQINEPQVTYLEDGSMNYTLRLTK